jgi:hypothetical protein
MHANLSGIQQQFHSLQRNIAANRIIAFARLPAAGIFAVAL